MLIKETGLLRIELEKACRQYGTQTPTLPEVIESHFTLIPALDWFKKVFFPAWVDYAQSISLKHNGYNCEQFMYEAVSFAIRSAVQMSNTMKQDFTMGVRPIRIDITKVPFMGINSAGAHCTCLIAFHRNSSAFELAVWEPQNLNFFHYEAIETGLRHFDFRDCWL